MRLFHLPNDTGYLKDITIVYNNKGIAKIECKDPRTMEILQRIINQHHGQDFDELNRQEKEALARAKELNKKTQAYYQRLKATQDKLSTTMEEKMAAGGLKPLNYPHPTRLITRWADYRTGIDNVRKIEPYSEGRYRVRFEDGTWVTVVNYDAVFYSAVEKVEAGNAATT